MECTQRLECSQESSELRSERVYPEQIGFLGICGVKHPVKKGPNKIGRDPQTCNIVLNLNSISRQHAVINILSQKEFMLMDLDSANKTKLMDKTLQPYIPISLKDGDMVQFGDIFGVFRLLEDENDLPMTQALDIPETPITTKYISKLNKAPITTIPESPDVSDRDDSFIAPSQPKGERCFNNSSGNFVKPSSKVISIQPIGSNKIDNVYWSSSKRSISLNSQLNDSMSNLNQSNGSDKSIEISNENIQDNKIQNDISNKKCISEQSDEKNIFEMETQVPFLNDKGVEKTNDRNIFEMETQDPFQNIKSFNKSNDRSMFDMETEAPFKNSSFNMNASKSIYDQETQEQTTNKLNITQDSIYTANTQLPTFSSSNAEVLPKVHKINHQQEMHINLFTSKELSNKSLNSSIEEETRASKTSNLSKEKSNVSGEEILFDEILSQDILDNLESQPLLPSDGFLFVKDNENQLNKSSLDNVETLGEKNNKHTDGVECEDINILPTQRILSKQQEDEDLTDCEDIDILPTQKITNEKGDDDLTDCEDILEDIPMKTAKVNKNPTVESNVDFEDMLTQVIDNNVLNDEPVNDISEMPTQVLDVSEDKIDSGKQKTPEDISFEDQPTQVIINEPTKINNNGIDTSPFKIPLQSPLRVKRKDINTNKLNSCSVVNKMAVTTIADHDDENYYAATQDIINDLCSQRESNTTPIEMKSKETKKISNKNICDSDDELVPSSVEDYKIGDKFPYIESNILNDLSSKKIRNVTGIEKSVDEVKKYPSDLSDTESTPKKVRSIKFMNIDLPNSQEIKTCVSLHKPQVAESSSDSDTELDTEEQLTPLLFLNKKKSKKNAKVDLTKKFDIETLPTRVITRVRKLPSKFLISKEESKETEQEEDIDKEIITENISRLKRKYEKTKNKNSKESKNSKECKKSERNKDATNDGNENDKTDNDKINKSEDLKSLRSNKEVQNNLTNDSSKGKEVRSNNKTRISDKQEKNPKKNSNSRCDENVMTVSKATAKNVVDVISKDMPIERCTRSTRNRGKLDSTKEKTSISHKENNTQTENKSKKTSNRKLQKTATIIDLTSDKVTDIRRSIRQRSSKNKTEVKSFEKEEKSCEPSKKKGRRKHEQSTVYSSLEPGTDSPSNLKRQATLELEPPSSKRTRVVNVDNNSSLRSTPARGNKTQFVLFTAFPCEEVKAKLEKLGAVIVTDVMSCTVVLTLQVKRTFKLLCCVGLGRPIVGPTWVQACADTNMIVDPWLYILNDEVAEKRFQFNLKRTLSSKRNFLKGYYVSSTPSVMPNAAEMKMIVECSGGVWGERGGQRGGGAWAVVSCAADRARWPELRSRGATLVSTEFILGGVLRQRIDIAPNKLA